MKRYILISKQIVNDNFFIEAKLLNGISFKASGEIIDKADVDILDWKVYQDGKEWRTYDTDLKFIDMQEICNNILL